jgi:hypothetical protein
MVNKVTLFTFVVGAAIDDIERRQRQFAATQDDHGTNAADID